MQRTILATLALVGFTHMAFAQPSFEPVPDNAVLSSNVKGLAVRNAANETVGTIEDQVVASGRLTGYILSVGGFLGMGERYVVVAPAGLRLAYDPKHKAWNAEMDVTKDQLKSAPAFTYEGRWHQ